MEQWNETWGQLYLRLPRISPTAQYSILKGPQANAMPPSETSQVLRRGAPCYRNLRNGFFGSFWRRYSKLSLDDRVMTDSVSDP